MLEGAVGNLVHMARVRISIRTHVQSDSIHPCSPGGGAALALIGSVVIGEDEIFGTFEPLGSWVCGCTSIQTKCLASLASVHLIRRVGGHHCEHGESNLTASTSAHRLQRALQWPGQKPRELLFTERQQEWLPKPRIRQVNRQVRLAVQAGRQVDELELCTAH